MKQINSWMLIEFGNYFSIWI